MEDRIVPISEGRLIRLEAKMIWVGKRLDRYGDDVDDMKQRLLLLEEEVRLEGSHRVRHEARFADMSSKIELLMRRREMLSDDPDGSE